MSNETDLFKLHRQGQDRYVYFLLAASGAAIGFALAQTKGEALEWVHAPLGAAVACWAFSFFAGCSQVRMIDATLYNNTELYRIRRGANADVGDHPQMIAAGVSMMRDIIEKQGNSAQRWARLQFRFLIAGAALYVAWHVLEMYLRRPLASPAALMGLLMGMSP